MEMKLRTYTTSVEGNHPMFNVDKPCSSHHFWKSGCDTKIFYAVQALIVPSAPLSKSMGYCFVRSDTTSSHSTCLENLPSVRLPLSDWALWCSSTNWHHPPGRSTRSISRRYPAHLFTCIAPDINRLWTRSKLWAWKVNLVGVIRPVQPFAFWVQTGCWDRPLANTSFQVQFLAGTDRYQSL